MINGWGKKAPPKPVKGGKKMEKQFVVAIALAIPVILIPAAFVWYLTLGGIKAAIGERKVARRLEVKA